MKKCKKFQTCKCIIWTKKNEFFACFYLFMITKKNSCFPKFIYQVEK